MSSAAFSAGLVGFGGSARNVVEFSPALFGFRSASVAGRLYSFVAITGEPEVAAAGHGAWISHDEDGVVDGAIVQRISPPRKQ